MINTALSNFPALSLVGSGATSPSPSATPVAEESAAQLSTDSRGDSQSSVQSSIQSTARALLTNELTEQEQQQVSELKARDREVRAHEQAHANVGGRYAGSPSYTYQRGPDGRNYAVGGEVAIDVSPVPNDPEATIQKAIIVRRAALAPAEPSAQDRAVAAEATAIEQRAKVELLAERADESLSQTGLAPVSNNDNQALVDNFLRIAESSDLFSRNLLGSDSIDVLV